MKLVDTTALAARLGRGADDLVAISDAIGVRIHGGVVRHLRTLGDLGRYDWKIGIPTILTLLSRAVRAPDDLFHERVQLGGDVCHVLIVRHEGKLTIDAALGDRAWPELEGWPPALDRAKVWAAQPAHLTLEIIAAPESAGDADEEARLRRAILDAPDGDGPRLVYADWLLERGDVRGDFIRLQCEEARATDVRRRREIARMIEPILQVNRTAFAGELAPYADSSAFRRGFVDVATMSIDDFVKDGRRLFELEPVRALRLTNDKFSEKDLERLASASGMPLVRELVIHQRDARSATRRPLAGLASGHRYDRLERIELARCGASATDWRSLFERLDAPALQELKLRWSYPWPALYEALGTNPKMANLRSLDEEVWSWPEAGAVELEAAIGGLARLPALEHLQITSREKALGDGAIVPFFESSAKATLRRLVLGSTRVTDETARAIAGSPKTTALEELELRDAAVTIAGVEAVIRSPHLTSLRKLTVALAHAQSWPTEAVRRLAEVLLELPASHPLREITLPGRGQPKGELGKALKTRFRLG